MPRTIRKSIYKLYLVFLLLGPNLSSYAQRTTTNASLISYLAALEKEFDIKFSYVDDAVNGITVSILKPSGLENILASIYKLKS